ncbi:MAG: sulfotransferase family protein, partial [Hyphomonadaceae bacterium]
MAQAKRTCVVIAGMHRSGTSALARVLNLLGCGLAKEVLGANPTNETGHWEPLEIMKLNDELLESAGSAWDDWTACSPDWFTSPIAGEFKERAARIFAEEHGTQRLTVMKDPRLARLLPFWLESLRASGVDPVVMIPIRNPLEVAQSLHVRDGSDPFYNQLL